MNKTIFFLVFSLVVLAACNDDDNTLSYEKRLAVDIDKIENYLIENDLTAESTESGLYYFIENEGTGSNPSIDSTVKISYTGKFLDNTTFDSGIIELELSQLILGFQEGIPLFKEGGNGKLFVPSALGYGIYSKNNIPGNSVLIFDIKLIEVSD